VDTLECTHDSVVQATIADMLVRTAASDTPSELSLHIAGRGRMLASVAEIKASPFGFSIGSFAAESRTMQFHDPSLVSTRARILDYFACQRSSIQPDHLIFCWEEGMAAVGEPLLCT
jgi:hypothetical protein